MDGQLARGALARVDHAVDEDLGLALVAGADVGRDADRPDGAALVALADRELGGDAGMVGHRVVDHVAHLGVGVEVAVAGWLGRGDRRSRSNTSATSSATTHSGPRVTRLNCH